MSLGFKSQSVGVRANLCDEGAKNLAFLCLLDILFLIWGQTVADYKMLSFHLSINVIIIVVSFKILDLCPIALFQQLWNTLYTGLQYACCIFNQSFIWRITSLDLFRIVQTMECVPSVVWLFVSSARSNTLHRTITAYLRSLKPFTLSTNKTVLSFSTITSVMLCKKILRNNINLTKFF